MLGEGVRSIDAMVANPQQPERRFFIRHGDHVDGPHPTSRILAWRREGKLPADILLSADGQRWQPVRWPGSAGASSPRTSSPRTPTRGRSPRG